MEQDDDMGLLQEATRAPAPDGGHGDGHRGVPVFLRPGRQFSTHRLCAGLESAAGFRDGLSDDPVRAEDGHQGLGRDQLVQRTELVADMGISGQRALCLHLQTAT